MIVYVLRLEKGNYYVGRTNNLDARLEAHKNGTGSAWTKKHRMIELFKTYEDDNPFYEDMVVKMMMNEHGIHKVRGGSYSQVSLPEDKILSIKNELYGASNKCFKCGGQHFVKDCIKSHSYLNDVISLFKSIWK